MNWSMLFTIAGGVALFLYGIKLMSEALQFIAGDRMRHLISAVTKTPLRGVLVGILVTVLIQSSSGTSVMAVSFVNAGLMTLKQAIGIIMGASVGTTVTAQIIAFKMQDMALPLIAVGVLLSFGKSKKLKYLGSGIVGLGLLFMGMQTMSAATKFMEGQKEFLLALSSNPIYGILAGILITMVVQSSAATIGLTMALASQGLMTLDVAIPTVLGDNIGTTITAVLATIGTNRHAKQVATAQVLFKALGVVIFMMFMPMYKTLVISSASDIERQIANAHTIFNIVNTLLFIPFVTPFSRLVEKIMPAPTLSVQPEQVTLYLDKKIISASATAAVEAVKDELMRMGAFVKDMFDIVRQAFSDEPSKYQEAFDLFEENEKHLNAINKAIGAYASEVWQKGLSEDGSTVLGCYVSAAGDMERIGDHLENIMELCPSIAHKLSEDALEEFWTMFDTVEESMVAAILSVEEENINKADLVIKTLERKIDAQEKQYRRNHLERLNQNYCDPERGVNFVDLLGNLERIGDHSDNIAQYTCTIVGLSSPVHKYKAKKAS